MKQPMSKTLQCGITVNGEVNALAQFSAKFQIKAREYGLTDSESLSVWIEGDNTKIGIYFKSRYTEYLCDLESGKNKLSNAPKTWNI